MKRPLFVFAGQSNMMGACVYDATEQIVLKNSYEYLHNPKRRGAPIGSFKQEGFPAGEFSYKDLDAAYGDGATVSLLDDYGENTYFCPSMTNLKEDSAKSEQLFKVFSEATASKMAPSLAPYLVQGLEDAGCCCAYTHIAKGGVSIRYYLEGDAKDYFYEKVADFFADCEQKFAEDDMSERVCVWLQGESDREGGGKAYFDRMAALWRDLKGAGFTKLMVVRVDYWDDDGIAYIMKAQEDFCAANEDAFIITRTASFIPWKGQNREVWYDGELPEEYEFCRDSFYGFSNQHLNDKAFRLIAKAAVPNIICILEGGEPVLEEELILPLKQD